MSPINERPRFAAKSKSTAAGSPDMILIGRLILAAVLLILGAFVIKNQIVRVILLALSAIASAFDPHGLCMDFQGLLGSGCQDHFTVYDHGAADRKIGQFLEVVKCSCIENDLEVAEAASVIYFQKTDVFGFPGCFYPACDSDLAAVCRKVAE